MSRAVAFTALLILVTAGAALLRLADLGNRPMHCDEANQAVRFGRLLELGQYNYDPEEHHGPSLYYLTLPIAWLAGAEKLTEVTEVQLRLLPAIFGIALVGLVWLLRDQLGYAAALWAALLTAVSPAMVFYSRYYVQEMLLVTFTFGTIAILCRQTSQTTKRGPGPLLVVWVVGACLGMMHASKETCVIAIAAMAGAGVVALGDPRRVSWKRLGLWGAVTLLVAVSLSALLFSSFFRSGQDVVESYTTYSHYLARASGEGSAGPHDYPWHHYFERLFWWQRDGGPVWTEMSIGVLALVGLAAGVLGKGLKQESLFAVRFLGVYTVLMTVIYSALPYKTPWCALGMLHGMILLAGIGAAVLVRLMPHWTLKGACAVLILAAAGHLAWQAHRASFTAYEDPTNPYVYAHTTSDIPRLVNRIEQIASVHPDGRAMHVQVICPEGDCWPLPWYLRHFSRVGWFDHVPRSLPAPLIITQPIMGSKVLNYAYLTPPPGERPMYGQLLPEQPDQDWQLRPHVPLHVYVHRDLLTAAEQNLPTAADRESPH